MTDTGKFGNAFEALKERLSSHEGLSKALERIDRLERHGAIKTEASEESFRLPYSHDARIATKEWR